ncbi:MAG: ATP-binding protein, partial [Planctomycetota bacterium]
PTSLRSVWRRAWATLTDRRAVAEANGGPRIRLVETGPELERAFAEVDPFRMEQVFRNLFENALDAIAEARRTAAVQQDIRRTGAAVTVETLSGPGRSGEFDICVADDGAGLDAEAAARLFEPFFTTKQKGTGLGMAIVARIVDLHDARIRVDRAESGGARFRLTFSRTNRPPDPEGSELDGNVSLDQLSGRADDKRSPTGLPR